MATYPIHHLVRVALVILAFLAGGTTVVAQSHDFDTISAEQLVELGEHYLNP